MFYSHFEVRSNKPIFFLLARLDALVVVIVGFEHSSLAAVAVTGTMVLTSIRLPWHQTLFRCVCCGDLIAQRRCSLFAANLDKLLSAAGVVEPQYVLS